METMTVEQCIEVLGKVYDYLNTLSQTQATKDLIERARENAADARAFIQSVASGGLSFESWSAALRKIQEPHQQFWMAVKDRLPVHLAERIYDELLGHGNFAEGRLSQMTRRLTEEERKQLAGYFGLKEIYEKIYCRGYKPSPNRLASILFVGQWGYGGCRKREVKPEEESIDLSCGEKRYLLRLENENGRWNLRAGWGKARGPLRAWAKIVGPSYVEAKNAFDELVQKRTASGHVVSEGGDPDVIGKWEAESKRLLEDARGAEEQARAAREAREAEYRAREQAAREARDARERILVNGEPLRLNTDPRFAQPDMVAVIVEPGKFHVGEIATVIGSNQEESFQAVVMGFSSSKHTTLLKRAAVDGPARTETNATNDASLVRHLHTYRS